MKKFLITILSAGFFFLAISTPAKAATVCNSFTDVFNGALNNRWVKYGTANPSGAKLSVTVPGSGADVTVSEVLTKDRYTGDLQISTRITNVAASQNPNANYGVMSSVGMYVDGNNIAAAYYEITAGKKYMGLWVINNGQVEDKRVEVNFSGFPIYLMLRRTGSTMTAFYKTTGGIVEVGSTATTNLASPAVLGIHSELWGTYPNGFTTTTDYTDFVAYCYSPVYRFWSDSKQTHFYTIDASERDFILANYKKEWNRYEGKVYSALQYTGTCPEGHSAVFRFWSDGLQRHFYTIDASERDVVRDTLKATWNLYEGPRFCAAQTPNNGSSIMDYGKAPLFRFWSDSKQAHFYTIDAGERDFILNTYKKEWNRYEGERFYAYPW